MVIQKAKSIKVSASLLVLGALIAAPTVTFAADPQTTAPAPSKGVDTVQEVVVTAQKREEKLQNVPISMTVLGGQALDSSTASGVTDALQAVPGVSTFKTYQGGGTLVTIRGVTSGEALFNGAGAVGYYLDSVPFGLIKTAIAPDQDAYDLNRVEVLRGPQGTLYGADALNGVVRVLTENPDLDHFELKARVSGSDTDGGGGNYRADAAINIPIIQDKLAIRGVIGYDDESGWINTPVQKDANDSKLLNMRAKIEAKPTDKLSVDLSVWSSRDAYGAPSVGQSWNFNSSIYAQPIHNNFNTVGLKVAYDFGFFNLSDSAGYLDYSSRSSGDFTPIEKVQSQLTTAITSHVYSDELLATSTGTGPWRWSIGGMYRWADENLVQTIPQFVFGLHNIDESSSYAVYGEATRTFADDTYELTAGLRYFNDDVSQVNQQDFGLPFLPSPDAHSKATTPRLVFTWKPERTLSLYASYSEGFRSGFPQAIAAAALPAAKPDLLTNYEIGAKGSLFDGRVSYDTAAYYINWTDVQQNVTVTQNGLPYAATVNGSAARGPGVDFSVKARPADGLTLNAALGWNDLTESSNVYTAGQLLYGKGSRLNFSPEYTGSVGAQYRFALPASGYSAHFDVAGVYTSPQENRVLLGKTVLIGQGDVMFVPRASFTVDAPNNWRATIYGDNLSNNHGIEAPGYGNLAAYYGRIRPLTIGLQLEYRYN